MKLKYETFQKVEDLYGVYEFAQYFNAGYPKISSKNTQEAVQELIDYVRTMFDRSEIVRRREYINNNLKYI